VDKLVNSYLANARAVFSGCLAVDLRTLKLLKFNTLVDI
jgi:hypothetical protein